MIYHFTADKIICVCHSIRFRVLGIYNFAVMCLIVVPRPHGLETRVIIKISTHHNYPRTLSQHLCTGLYHFMRLKFEQPKHKKSQCGARHPQILADQLSLSNYNWHPQIFRSSYSPELWYTPQSIVSSFTQHQLTS